MDINIKYILYHIHSIGRVLVEYW